MCDRFQKFDSQDVYLSKAKLNIIEIQARTQHAKGAFDVRDSIFEAVSNRSYRYDEVTRKIFEHAIAIC